MRWMKQVSKTYLYSLGGRHVYAGYVVLASSNRVWPFPEEDGLAALYTELMEDRKREGKEGQERRDDEPV